MTIFEANELMVAGVKMTHPLFTKEEFITIAPDGKYLFEDGCKCEQKEFWKYRQDNCWLTDWARWEN